MRTTLVSSLTAFHSFFSTSTHSRFCSHNFWAAHIQLIKGSRLLTFHFPCAVVQSLSQETLVLGTWDAIFPQPHRFYCCVYSFQFVLPWSCPLVPLACIPACYKQLMALFCHKWSPDFLCWCSSECNAPVQLSVSSQPRVCGFLLRQCVSRCTSMPVHVHHVWNYSRQMHTEYCQ